MDALLREDALPTARHGEDPTHSTFPFPLFPRELCWVRPFADMGRTIVALTAKLAGARAEVDHTHI